MKSVLKYKRFFIFALQSIGSLCFQKAIASEHLYSSKNENNTYITCTIHGLEKKNRLEIRFLDNVFGAFGNEDVNYKDYNTEKSSYLKSIFNAERRGDNFYFRWSNLTVSKNAVLYSTDRSSFVTKMIDTRIVLQRGDSIVITERDGNLYFTGRDSSRYACENDIFQIQKSPALLTPPDSISDVGIWYAKVDSLADNCFDILNSYRSRLPSRDYWIIYGQILSGFENLKTGYLYWRGGLNGDSTNKFYKYLSSYRTNIWNNTIKCKLANNWVLNHSFNFLNFLIRQYKYDSCFVTRSDFDLVRCIKYFSKIYSGSTREWLLYRLISDNLRSPDQDLSFCIQFCFKNSYIRNESIIEYFTSVENNNVSGSLAFNFALINGMGDTVHLKDFRGRVILLDFWYIGCGSCIRLHPFLDGVKSRINSNKFVIVSICVDYTGESLKKWPEAVASDRYTNASNVNLFAGGDRKGDPEVTRQFRIKSCPTIILIDSNGNIERQPIDPRLDNGDSIVTEINRSLAKINTVE